MIEEKRQTGNERDRKEDSECVRAFLAGDKDMFDGLVLRYQHMVFNLCYRFLGDYDEADDCAQETFVKVFRSLKSFRFDASFATWLYSITVNTCKNRLKAADYRYRKKMVSITPVDDTNSKTPPYEIEDHAPSPFSRLEAKESELLLQRAIDSLSHDAKTVILLRDIEGLSYEEIAHITGYNLGTVKSKLARARQQLRQMLREEKD
jgi:RNA polymerase sigma-70 factor, ECF subfamily